MFPKINFQFKSEAKEGVQKMDYPEVFSNHFCWAIVGSPGSGKTTFIQNILEQKDMYKDKFDYIFVVSPSNIKIQGVDNECQTDELKLEWIYERINYLQNLNIKGANLLIILDDCISQIKKLQNESMLVNLFFNRRHIWKGNTISIILTTQQFTMLPLRFRSVCDHFAFLSLSPRDFDFVKKELIYSSSRKCMDQVVQTFQGPPHQFIYIRLQPFLLCQNFKPLIRGSSYVSLSNDFSTIQQYKPAQQQPQKSLPVAKEQPVSLTIPQNISQDQLFSFKGFSCQQQQNPNVNQKFTFSNN